jgi:hypothetical protein
MPKPCGHPVSPVAGCSICRVAEECADYRDSWDLPPKAGLTKLCSEPAETAPQQTEADWPFLVRQAAKFKRDGDRGLGDTVARNLHKLGASAMQKVYKAAFGKDCGCGDRQERLNTKYPYSTTPREAAALLGERFCGKPAERPGIAVRHLLYHCAPMTGNGTWQRNIQQLMRRAPLWNGRRTVAVVRGAGMDSIDTVRAEFARNSFKAEFIEADNQPNLREVVTHHMLFETVKEFASDPAHATLYAHAKGVSRPVSHPTHTWTEALYETMCDYWQFVDSLLRTHPVAGSFKKIGRGWPGNESLSDWHYSGSWFWFRNSELFSRDWTRIDKFWSGIEPYPSLHFCIADAGCVFYQDSVPRMNLYDWKLWRKTVLPALMDWRVTHAMYRGLPCLSN